MNFAIFSPFFDNGNDFMYNRAKISQQEAGLIIFLPTFVCCIITTPFKSWLNTVKGHRNIIIIVNLMYIATFILLLFLPS